MKMKLPTILKVLAFWSFWNITPFAIIGAGFSASYICKDYGICLIYFPQLILLNVIAVIFAFILWILPDIKKKTDKKRKSTK